jgi:DNA-binding YbaB/EbfC family protein
MANLMKMMKQAASMQREMKRVQKGLAKQKVEAADGSGRIRVVARGDMHIDRIELDPALLSADGQRALERELAATVNKALEMAKQAAGDEMAKVTAGMDLPGLPG